MGSLQVVDNIGEYNKRLFTKWASKLFNFAKQLSFDVFSENYIFFKFVFFFEISGIIGFNVRIVYKWNFFNDLLELGLMKSKNMNINLCHKIISLRAKEALEFAFFVVFHFE